MTFGSTWLSRKEERIHCLNHLSFSRSDHKAVERYVIGFGNTSLGGSSEPFLDLHLISQHPHVVT